MSGRPRAREYDVWLGLAREPERLHSGPGFPGELEILGVIDDRARAGGSSVRADQAPRADGAGARVSEFTACMGPERAMDTVERRRDADVELVVSWRFNMLFRAGYSRNVAFELARQPHVDLHLATELLERGCPVATARKILL